MADGSTFADLLSTISSSKAAHKESTALRRTTGPRIPLVEHQFDIKNHWNPLPSKESVRQALDSDAGKHFNRFSKSVGAEYSEPAYLKAGCLDAWTAARAVQPNRSYEYPPPTDPRGKFRSRAQPDVMPQPRNDMCHRMHREWLDGEHERQRQKHLNPIHQALLRVDRAQRLLDTHAEQRQTARDLMTKAPDKEESLNLHPVMKSTLSKVMLGVKASKAFQSAGNLDFLAAEEKRDRERVQRAKSSPALSFKEQDPPHRPRHLHRWAGTDGTGRSLRESTPWRDQDEERTLAARRRDRVR